MILYSIQKFNEKLLNWNNNYKKYKKVANQLKNKRFQIKDIYIF